MVFILWFAVVGVTVRTKPRSKDVTTLSKTIFFISGIGIEGGKVNERLYF